MTAQTALRLAEILLMLLMLPVSTALYRQAHLMAERLRRTGLAAIEGPEVGDLAPGALRGTPARDWLFVVETCTSTPDVLAVLGALADHDRGVRLVLMPRTRGHQVVRHEAIQARVGSLQAEAAPWLGVVDGEEALALGRSVGIHSGPLYLRVVRGLVLDKRYVKSADDMWAALDAAGAPPGEQLEQTAWSRS